MSFIDGSGFQDVAFRRVQLTEKPPDAAPRMIAARRTEHEYSVTHHGEWLFILTNSGGAEDFRIMRAPVSAPEEANWEEIVPHKRGRLISGMTFEAASNEQRPDFTLEESHVVRGKNDGVVLSPLGNPTSQQFNFRGRQRIRVIPWDDSGEHEVSFEEPAYHLHLRDNFELATDLLRFGYTSLRTPRSFFDYDMRTRQRVLLKREPVVGVLGFRQSDDWWPGRHP